MSDLLREAAYALAETRSRINHGQLCPYWTRRAYKRHAVPIADCDCWILADAIKDVGVVAAALAAPPPGLDVERLARALRNTNMTRHEEEVAAASDVLQAATGGPDFTPMDDGPDWLERATADIIAREYAALGEKEAGGYVQQFTEIIEADTAEALRRVDHHATIGEQS